MEEEASVPSVTMSTISTISIIENVILLTTIAKHWKHLNITQHRNWIQHKIASQLTHTHNTLKIHSPLLFLLFFCHINLHNNLHIMCFFLLLCCFATKCSKLHLTAEKRKVFFCYNFFQLVFNCLMLAWWNEEGVVSLEYKSGILCKNETWPGSNIQHTTRRQTVRYSEITKGTRQLKKHKFHLSLPAPPSHHLTTLFKLKIKVQSRH